MKSTQLKKTHVEDILKESEGETSEDELIEITKIIPQKVNHMDNRQTVITAKKINSDSKTIYSTLHEDMKKC